MSLVPPSVASAVCAGVSLSLRASHPGRGRDYAGHLSDEAIANALARSVGMFGSMAQYVYLTARHLEVLGLCDDRMWRMQDMIAERIERDFPGQIPPR
jgi:cation transport regulator ChaC